ncbi:hypothetical protein QQP08_005552 [Theobroma cacao]|nr:hypothetical protein QQP08_005552 [Theobroma cacao]
MELQPIFQNPTHDRGENLFHALSLANNSSAPSSKHLIQSFKTNSGQLTVIKTLKEIIACHSWHAVICDNQVDFHILLMLILIKRNRSRTWIPLSIFMTAVQSKKLQSLTSRINCSNCNQITNRKQKINLQAWHLRVVTLALKRSLEKPFNELSVNQAVINSKNMKLGLSSHPHN